MMLARILKEIFTLLAMNKYFVVAVMVGVVFVSVYLISS